MPSFNLGFNQRRFNGTTAVSRQAINMGTMRGKGSTSRMFNFCKTHSTKKHLRAVWAILDCSHCLRTSFDRASIGP